MNLEPIINPACFVVRDDKATFESLEAVVGPGNVIRLDEDSIIRSVPLKSFWYLATPYSKYPDGKEKAYEDACKVTAWLVQNKMAVFCPIAHTHGPSAAIPPELDTHDTWLAADYPFIVQALGMIICKMPGWQESYGVNWEIDEFRKLKKPIVTIDWPFDPAAKPRLTPYAVAG